jgi:serine/threonine protein kinase
MAERWDEIDRVWHAVLDSQESDRSAVLDDLCAGDPALRRDVESLLGHLTRASAAGFGSVPVGTLDLESLIGRQIGPYAVHARLGSGGMGEVFRATDATLGRDVAIKILPDLCLADEDRRARFDREARVLAAINHPNIGSIYGVHEAGDIRALVLELVEGETLAERLARRAGPSSRRGVPIDEVMTIAGQILDALEAAHGRGIVHRDLKPANIKITPDRRVKVLDFGLAFAMGGDGGDAVAASSPTRPGQDTLGGALLGTPAYMSPEQARGGPVDNRTDVWAFGCVLYEMLTGVQAFRGDSIGYVIASVIKADVDWTLLPGDTPRAVRMCLRRCLQKDAKRRFHHVADVRLALAGAFESQGDDEGSRSRRRLERLALAGWAVAAAAIMAAIAVFVPLRGTPSSVPNRELKAATPPVLVMPQIGGGGTATASTIQGAIDLAARGATVSILPGTYTEALTIKRGLTLQATGERSGAVVVAPAGAPDAAIDIATTEPVTIRGLTIHATGKHGLRAIGAVNVTVERSTVLAVNPPGGRSALVLVSNDAGATGARARAAIRRNLIDGSVARLPQGVPRPQNHALQLVGDLDAVVDGNMVRRTGAMCIVVDTREDFGGTTNVDIVNNDIDECHPVARVGAIKVGSPSIATLSPREPITATGVVNITGNTIRNSSEDCLNNAIAYNVFAGRIERNRILDFVKPCAKETPRNMPAAIWLGLRVTGLTIPSTTPTVRFNDISGNAHAGVRVGPDQTAPADVSCNYWGSEDGPAGIGRGRGDAILVEEGAPAPVFRPFATAPIAQSTRTGC